MIGLFFIAQLSEVLLSGFFLSPFGMFLVQAFWEKIALFIVKLGRKFITFTSSKFFNEELVFLDPENLPGTFLTFSILFSCLTRNKKLGWGVKFLFWENVQLREREMKPVSGPSYIRRKNS